MKVNYDFYTGKDTYCDGDVEIDVLKYLEEFGEENYRQIFEKDIRWPVFYHITPIRKNILNWYKFKENADVLEIGAGMGAITGILCDKAGYVTSVELSKQRAKAIEQRCKNKENLELIVGNFNDIKFNKKFDYITLIGVLEYAPLYTDSENPFEDFLKKIKQLLKDDGKLLIAIENQFGMKYFSGVEEDHTNKVFDGITGYENKCGIRTFGKFELKEILKNSGFGFTKFYYPMPDYKLPNVIFSDEYLPNSQTIDEYIPYLSNECSKVKFDEKEAYKDIIKNGQFDFFANSFFIEASYVTIDTDIDLSRQSLVKVDNVMRKFYDVHYGFEDNDNFNKCLEEENGRLVAENGRLNEELNRMVNSRSWRITRPFRNFRMKYTSRDKE